MVRGDAGGVWDRVFVGGVGADAVSEVVGEEWGDGEGDVAGEAGGERNHGGDCVLSCCGVSVGYEGIADVQFAFSEKSGCF